MKQFLINVLEQRISLEQRAWLQDSVRAASQPASAAEIQRRYTEASRRVGKTALQLSAGEKARLRLIHESLILDHWGTDEAARLVLLLSAGWMSAEDYERTALDCYELGDSREQQSWLRALSLLPHCARFLPVAIDACRTNIIPLFEAIACENSYPALYFPELNFNQMVLKCLFNRIELRRIAGLESRLNAELARMADHYALERRAAGRDVPPDIGMAGVRERANP